MIAEGLVSENGRRRRKAGDRLVGGEALVLRRLPPVAAEPQAEPLPLSIVYEDAHLIVVDKPAGMAVHPGPGHAGSTLVNALLAHCPDLPGIGGVQRPGIVHRLDKDTSGLIIAAKDERTLNGLAAQLKERSVKKTYLALVTGKIEPAAALIDAPIGRDPHNRRRMMVRGAAPPAGAGQTSSTGSGQGRESQTAYRVRERYDGYSLLEVSPVTGRTHQIRVHLASLGHPVVGDAVYGHASPIVGRQFLHAWRLAFRHPADGRELAFETPLAPDLAAALAALKARHPRPSRAD